MTTLKLICIKFDYPMSKHLAPLNDSPVIFSPKNTVSIKDEIDIKRKHILSTCTNKALYNKSINITIFDKLYINEECFQILKLLESRCSFPFFQNLGRLSNTPFLKYHLK